MKIIMNTALMFAGGFMLAGALLGLFGPTNLHSWHGVFALIAGLVAACVNIRCEVILRKGDNDN